MHHGSPKDHGRYDDVFESIFDDASMESALSLLERMVHIYGLTAGDTGWAESEKDEFKRLTNLISGIISFSDWVASGVCEPFENRIMDLEKYREISIIRASSLFESDMLGIGRKAVSKMTFVEMFGFLPSPLQSSIGSLNTDEARMVIVEDATGSGKTEAALSLAMSHLADSDLSGITFTLPTTSTTNLMFKRLSMDANGRTVSLAHGNARYFLETEGIDLSGSWAVGGNKSLFANVAVCTLDQALRAVIPVRYNTMKLLSLVRHVIVIDEVHAYDAYTFGLICKLVSLCKLYGMPLIILSATIPIAMRKDLVESFGISGFEPSSAFPLITVCGDEAREVLVDASERSVRKVSTRYISDHSIIIKEMVKLAEEGLRICWIRNTVDDAIDAYDELPWHNKILIHSRFIMNDRIEKEGEIFRRCGKGAEPGEGLIVVSTQVIEQSMDIQFDRMYSDLAPIDSLIQRMGRDQRFGDSPIPCEFIVNGPSLDEKTEDWYYSYLPKASFVYRNHYSLWRTAELMTKGVVNIPNDYRQMIEYAYSVPEDSDPLFKRYKEYNEEKIRSRSNSEYASLDPMKMYGCQHELRDDSITNADEPSTRETDGRTLDCILLAEEDGKHVPISGNPQTSVVSIKRKYVPDHSDEFDYGKWKYYGKIVLRKSFISGKETYSSGTGIEYTKEKGVRYV